MGAIPSFHADIKQILEAARNRAHSAINAAMVEAYWLIGKRIVEEEQQGEKRATYGKRLLENLSIDLGQEYGKGFSYANLRNFRQFYLTYPGQKICYTVCSKLSWSHNRLIMRVDDPKTRQYYLTEASEQQWNVRQLERNIKSHSYQRLLSSQEQISHTEHKAENTTKLDFIKDPYVLEFLQLPEQTKLKESRLEQAIINELKNFLLEMGKGFSFVARQMRISTETSHFYIDLVFYNYLLKCFVIIDLKTGKLSHQDIGQMDMYVRLFDDLKRGEDDNPTIGIILCDNKDDTIVKYSVLKESEQIFASKYRRILPSEEELIAEIAREKRLIAGME
ncbi:PDDEXK nuclease domain-containing protein [Candidatus Spongiihabitans sp.]|uniref:PDDEXK nuclease domain-containing protein n=1 Tax=Candidatus Spongiihabitans sp. TaxID=3101308 RepID=UPI003C7DBB49